MPADIEDAPSGPVLAVAPAGEARVFVEDRVRAVVVEAIEAHAPRHFAQRPPVGARFAGRRQEGALARDAALGIGHRAILFAPAQRRQQHVGIGGGVGGADDVADHHQFAFLERAPHLVGVRQADQRIGGDDPDRLDRPLFHRAEQVDRLQARLRGDGGRVPEFLDGRALDRIVEVHVRGQHVGQAADFAPAHRVRLAGQRERPHAGLADAAGEQVAVDDGVDLVGAARGLVHALRIGGDDVIRGGEGFVEGEQPGRVDAADARHLRRVAAIDIRDGQRRVQPFGMGRNESRIDDALLRQVAEQPVEQPDIGARLDRQVDVGRLAGRRPARVDHHDAQRGPRLFRAQDALEQGRMAPGRVRADQHDHLGQFEVVVAAGHQVFAEGALVAGDAGGHAQARIGVDVRAADIALHEFVGDVVILGQQLARHVQRHRIRAVLGDDGSEAAGHPVERLVPAGAAHGAAVVAILAHHRVQQAPVEVQGFAQRRALDAQASLVRRVGGIAGDDRDSPRAHGGGHAAADAAIWTGGAHGLHGKRHVHGGSLIIQSAGAHSASPNNRRSRKLEMSAPRWIRSKYQGPSPTSPTSTAPVTRPPASTSRL